MKRSNVLAFILLGSGLSIGCKSPPQSDVNPLPPANTTTQSTTGAQTIDATNTQQPPQFCESNCEEKAMDVKVPLGKPLPLNPEEQTSLNHALKQSADGQTHIEGTAANGGFQFHPAPGPARITANTPQIAVRSASDPKQIIRIPLTPEAVQLARPRTGAASH